MRSTYLRNWIACGIVIGLWAVVHVDPWAEAQSVGQGEGSKSSSQSSAGELAASPRLQPASAVSLERSSVSLSPAVAMVKCRLGQSSTQTLTISNQTQQELVFEMIAQDVVVRDGKRAFVAAGETPGGIAATAVFTQKEVVVKPLRSSSGGGT